NRPLAFGFAGRLRPLLYCVFAFYESNLTYVTVPFILLPLNCQYTVFMRRVIKQNICQIQSCLISMMGAILPCRNMSYIIDTIINCYISWIPVLPIIFFNSSLVNVFAIIFRLLI